MNKVQLFLPECDGLPVVHSWPFVFKCSIKVLASSFSKTSP